MEQPAEIEKTETAAPDGDAPRRPPVRVAVAGLGRAAMGEHLPALLGCRDLFTVIAVCDHRKERRDAVEKVLPDVRTYRYTNDMMDDPDIEAVLVTLPTVAHQRLALDALARERWAIVDTPLATSHDDALILRAASIKARGRLVPYTSGLFAPDFRLAMAALDDPRLGDLYEVRIRRQDYIRRDDWQAIKRCGGGAVNYAAQDALMQAVALLRSPPAQMWSELKRIASLGDAEDFAHIVLKTRGVATADIEINGGTLPPFEPAFTLRGSRGSFFVAAGAKEGTFHVIDPGHKFPRRRSSVRTPPFEDMHESLPILDVPMSLPEGCETGCAAFWRAMYGTVRIAAPPPTSVDDTVETLRYMQLVKRGTPFAN